jgi:hypothetical protein
MNNVSVMKTQAKPTTATVSAPKSPKTTIRDKSPKATASAMESSKATASAGVLQGLRIRDRPVRPEEGEKKKVIVRA